jgi:hypothetical protein
MTDAIVGRYRRAYPRIWRHPGFVGLTQSERILVLYLLQGPQSNRIGLFHFSVSTAAEDLGVGLETLRKGLSNVCLTFGWLCDSEARVFYIPSWWRWNRPDNLNVLRGSLKDISELPPCGLVDAFASNLTYVPPDVQETFIETLMERLPKRSGTQEQEQKQYQKQDQKQKPTSRLRNEASASNRRAQSDASESLVKVAIETLKLTSPNRPLEELVDAFQNQFFTSTRTSCTRAQALEAINRARLESGAAS